MTTPDEQDQGAQTPVHDPAEPLIPEVPEGLVSSEVLEDVFARRFANDDQENTDALDPATDQSTDDDADAPPAEEAAPTGAAPDANDATGTGDPAGSGPADLAVDADAGATQPGADSESQGTPSHLSVPVPGTDQTYDLDVNTATDLLALAAWSNSLTEDTRTAFAAIEQGVAVAITKADFDAFQAWRQRNTTDDSYDDLDPQTADRIAALERENAALRSQPATNEIHQRTNDAASAFDDTAISFARDHGLSDAEMANIYESAIRANVIPNIAESMRQYSPSGSLLRDADYSEVAKRAFNFALVNDPALHTRAIQHAATPVATTPPSNDPIAGLPPTEDPDPTIRKKANAGSLAAAPSSSFTNSTPPAAMSRNDLTAAMAEELRSAMAGR